MHPWKRGQMLFPCRNTILSSSLHQFQLTACLSPISWGSYSLFFFFLTGLPTCFPSHCWRLGSVFDLSHLWESTPLSSYAYYQSLPLTTSLLSGLVQQGGWQGWPLLCHYTNSYNLEMWLSSASVSCLLTSSPLPHYTSSLYTDFTWYISYKTCLHPHPDLLTSVRFVQKVLCPWFLCCLFPITFPPIQLALLLLHSSSWICPQPHLATPVFGYFWLHPGCAGIFKSNPNVAKPASAALPLYSSLFFLQVFHDHHILVR